MNRIRNMFKKQPDKSDVFLIIGTCSLSYGCFSIYPPAGYIAAGVVFTALAVVSAR